MGLYKRRGSPFYWTRHTVGGEPKFHSTGVKDRKAAQIIAAELLMKDERRLAGLDTETQDLGRLPLEDHLKAFETSMKARGVVEQYVEDRMGCLRLFVEHAKIRLLRDITLDNAQAFVLAEKEAGLSARTLNRRIGAMKAFCMWAVETARLDRTPLATLKLQREATDRRRVGRALSSVELGRVLLAAAQRPLEQARAQRTRKGVTPEEVARLKALGAYRVFVYRFASATGLRRRELRLLRWGYIDLDEGQITLPAPVTKSRRVQSVPLRRDLAAACRERRGTAGPEEFVFPPKTFPNLRTFKRDLVAAGIATVIVEKSTDGKRARRTYVTKNAAGKVVDFHSTRRTFTTSFATRGIHPRIAQALARHAKVDMTMSTYTDEGLLDLRGAIEDMDLPDVPDQDLGLSRQVSRSAAAAARPGAAPCAPTPEPDTTETASQRRTAAHCDAAEVVGVTGLEPVTPSLSSWCSSQLS